MKKSDGSTFMQWYDELRVRSLNILGFNYPTKEQVIADYNNNKDSIELADNIVDDYREQHKRA